MNFLNRKFLKQYNIKLKFSNEYFKQYGTQDMPMSCEIRYDIRFPKSSNIIWIKEKYSHNEKFKTFLLHEIGHIIFQHKIGDLREECEADKFSLDNGGKIEHLLEILKNIGIEYYGDYIIEPYLRKFLLLLKFKKNNS